MHSTTTGSVATLAAPLAEELVALVLRGGLLGSGVVDTATAMRATTIVVLHRHLRSPHALHVLCKSRDL